MAWTFISKTDKKDIDLCRCHCGTVKEVRRNHRISGASGSCGCEARKALGERRRTHGMSQTRLFRIWAQMRRRCTDESLPKFRRYGGRDITVCPEWDSSFVVFRDWALVNGYADKLTIDRIDNNGNYDPNNCRWADAKTQALNRNDTHKLPDGSIGFHVAEANGINAEAFRARVRLGWSVEEASTRPLRMFSRGLIPLRTGASKGRSKNT